jgi:adenylate cyclase class 2
VEIEAKFHLEHLHDIRKRIIALGGNQLTPRALERNWRFDTDDRDLAARREVLRVRQYGDATLTFKSPTERPEERIEIEIQVDDADQAKSLLEVLGYSVSELYEKYRESFRLETAIITLDELPFGFFVEIEGESLASIQATAELLELDWEARITEPYLDIYHRLQRELQLDTTNATFIAFEPIDAIDLTQFGYPKADTSA